jgi:hypothetical protein
MPSRVPPEAFAVYLNMGPNRSYQAVADHFKVSKAAITARAVEEKWAERLEEAERKAKETSEAKAVESLQEMSERHLRIVRVIQARALEALKVMPIHSANAAVRALVESVKLECTLRGQPSERTAISMEQLVRSEYERWMMKDGRDGWAEEEAKDGGNPGDTGQAGAVS